MGQNSYKIGTFGHRGVGKSTYLATLYILLSQSRYEGVKIEFGEDGDLLSDYLDTIIDEYDKSGLFQLPPTASVPIETKFTLFRKGAEYVINLFDYRGEDSERDKIDEKAAEDIESVLDHFKKCDAVMYFFTDDIILGKDQKNNGYRIKRLNDLKTLLVRLRKHSETEKIKKPFIFVLTKGDALNVDETTFDKNQDVLRILKEYVDDCKTTLISSKLAFENLYNDTSFVIKEQQSDDAFYMANTDVAYPLFYLIDELDNSKLPDPPQPQPRPRHETYYYKEESFLEKVEKFFRSFGVLFLIMIAILVAIMKFANESSGSVTGYKAYAIGHRVWLLRDCKRISIEDTLTTIDGVKEITINDSCVIYGIIWYNIDYNNLRGWISSIYTISKKQLTNAHNFYVSVDKASFYQLDGLTFKKKMLT